MNVDISSTDAKLIIAEINKIISRVDPELRPLLREIISLLDIIPQHMRKYSLESLIELIKYGIASGDIRL